jgi:hypothetical protein
LVSSTNRLDNVTALRLMVRQNQKIKVTDTAVLEYNRRRISTRPT